MLPVEVMKFFRTKLKELLHKFSVATRMRRNSHVKDTITIGIFFYVILLLITGIERTPGQDDSYQGYPYTIRGIRDLTPSGHTPPSATYNDTRYILIPNCANVSENTVVVFVHSHLKHIGRRAAIRATWGNSSFYGNTTYDGMDIVVIFVVGFYDDTGSYAIPDRELLIGIKAESTVNDDILFVDMIDQYDNLAHKSLLTMLWIQENCARARYIYKADDDVLLNTFAWLRVIQQLKTKQMSCCIVCCVWLTPPVLREGRYATTREEYSADQFPDFCSGSGYLMSRDAMDAILEVARHVALFKRDDPYFTGILARSAKATLITVQQKSYLFHPQEMRYSDDDTYLLIHDPTPIQWGEHWFSFLSKHQNQSLRQKLTLYTVPQTGSFFLPAQYTVPYNTILERQCRKPEASLFDVDI